MATRIFAFLAVYSVHQCHAATVLKISEYMDSNCQTDQFDQERYVSLDACLMESASVWLKYTLMGSNYYKQYYNVTGCTGMPYDEDVVSKDQCNAKPTAAGVNQGPQSLLPTKYWRWTSATATMVSMSMYTTSACTTKSSDVHVAKDVCISDTVFETDKTIAANMQTNIGVIRGVKYVCDGYKLKKTTYNNTDCTDDTTYTEATVEYVTTVGICKTVTDSGTKYVKGAPCGAPSTTATTGSTTGSTTGTTGTTGNSTSGNATTAATTATTGNALVNGAMAMSCRWALLLLGALLATMSQ